MKLYNATLTILELYNRVEREEKALFVLDDEDPKEFATELYSPNIILRFDVEPVKNLKISSKLVKARAYNILNGN